jgi:phosphoribosylamine-glycine ligase
VGETPSAAFDACYQMLKEVRVPQGQYRTDICEVTTRRYWQLREGGYLK